MENQRDEFYIGYLDTMPEQHQRLIRTIIILLVVGMTILGVLVALSMKKFKNSTFEFGTLTSVEGVVYQSPVPIIKIFTQDYSDSKSVLLTNYLKFGATDLIEQFRSELDQPFEKSLLKLRGTLIYYDGVTLLELTEKENALIEVNNFDNVPQTKVNEIGWVSLKGEIVDSKCFFGAMNPGSGKVHRSCAVRCISGGIPPVLAITNARESNYFLLLGPNGQPIHKEVLAVVGQPVQVNGNLQKFEEWFVLFVNPLTDIKPLDEAIKAEQDLMALTSCRICDHL